MKASDLDLEEGLSFNPESGITTFEHTRMVILNAESLGLLRQKLIEEVGWEGARELFLQFGFQTGHSDLYQLRAAYDFETPEELSQAGPVMHTYEGIVKAEPTDSEVDREAGEFRSAGIWHNSYEAEQHLAYNEPADEPTCWTLMGYASGYSTAFMGEPILGIEPECVGMGDDRCEWLLKPVSEWGDEAQPYIEALESYFESERKR